MSPLTQRLLERQRKAVLATVTRGAAGHTSLLREIEAMRTENLHGRHGHAQATQTCSCLFTGFMSPPQTTREPVVILTASLPILPGSALL